MALIDNPGDFPSVRALIAAWITARQLPDTTIALPVFLDRAEREVASRTEDTGDLAKQAAMYFLASLLAPTVEVIKRQTIADDTIETAPFDAKGRASDLWQAGLEAIAAIGDAEPNDNLTEDMPFLFGTVKAGRCSDRGY